ncbi:MAG: DMT family transporter [Bdellovibrionaceae bacterium]|nr:DMT family transporter [Pseudobdellovibrionaceae bacterium]
MSFLLISVMLFGLVHPISKVILQQGIPLSYFCILFVGIRLFFQIALFLFKKTKWKFTREVFLLLLLLGGTGACLQYFEFKGIDNGLEPAIVTFIVFSYPIWILLYSVIFSKSKLSRLEIGQSLMTVGGIFLISQVNLTGIKLFSATMLFPIVASLAIAVWIVVSAKLRQKGVGAFELSLFYDLFSILVLALVCSSSLVEERIIFMTWSQSSKHILSIILYALIAGFLPNILFYMGVRKLPLHSTGLIMALEPLFSTLYSILIWKMTFGIYFIIGAVCILVGSFPKEIFSQALLARIISQLSMSNISTNFINKYKKGNIL